MTRSSILFLSLLGLTLTACSGDTACSEDCDNSEAVRGADDTECCGTTDDTATQAEMAELVVNSTFNANTEAGDVVEPCEVVIGNKFAGNTGETIWITPDVVTEVEVGILDGPHTTDGLPLHVLNPSWDETVWAGASVVTPKQTVTGDLSAPQTVNAKFNLWQADTWWTCNEIRSWDGGSDTFTAMSYYHNGNKFLFEFGEVTVTGINFQIDDSFTGKFTSPTEAVATWQQTETAYVTMTCFTSTESGSRVDAEGNIIE